jgi:hypothetical protein
MRLLKTVSYSFLNGCGIELSYLLLGIVFGTLTFADARAWWPVWVFGFVSLYYYIGRVWWKQVKTWKDHFKLKWWQLLLYKLSTLCLGILIGSMWPTLFLGWLSVLLLVFIILDLITAAVYLEG